MIKLTDKLEYDETLSFWSQTNEVQEYIKNLINTLTPENKTEEQAGVYPRPLKEWYRITTDLVVCKTYIYEYPAEHESNGIVKEVIYG